MSANDEAPRWAVVELMGHIRYGGLVSKDTLLATAMLRIDVPQSDGSFITQLINPQSLYRLTLCDETIARAAAMAGEAKPLHTWELPRALPPSTDSDDNDQEISY